jgi:hypothetical protein
MYEDIIERIREKPSATIEEKVVCELAQIWTHLNVWNEAMKYFQWDKTYSVRYSDYLVNHTQKLAVDLADFFMQSKLTDEDGIDWAIDAVPVLTETGGGAPMAFYDGTPDTTTRKLACTWCGDLLQIVAELPEDYKIINCCFAKNIKNPKTA